MCLKLLREVSFLCQGSYMHALFQSESDLQVRQAEARADRRIPRARLKKNIAREGAGGMIARLGRPICLNLSSPARVRPTRRGEVDAGAPSLLLCLCLSRIVGILGVSDGCRYGDSRSQTVWNSFQEFADYSVCSRLLDPKHGRSCATVTRDADSTNGVILSSGSGSVPRKSLGPNGQAP